MLRVEVDRDRCQAAAECVRIAPASFRIDDTVTAVAAEPAGDPDLVLLEAVRSCPNEAIRAFRDGVEIDAFADDESPLG